MIQCGERKRDRGEMMLCAQVTGGAEGQTGRGMLQEGSEAKRFPRFLNCTVEERASRCLPGEPAALPSL